jgi:hypothetical protein
LTAEEMPPVWMWILNDDLEAHFEWVRDKRNPDRDDDDDRSGPMLQNEYARGRGRNAG